MWLERHGIDFTVVGIALGVVLLGALVRPWGQVYPRWVPFLRGRRVPRWIPLTPGWIAGLSLAVYGCMGMSVILTGGLATAHTAGLAPGVFVIGFINFTSIGVSLSICSLSYQRRTRTQTPHPIHP
ncbi:hypothetical protein [Actinomadura rupiterrae]|uniref:hypothetical protein n=1 Tax=Actinomadura rupiterrae TaxID=559627 RepID=UPI0020A33F1F|nr:hypothetical protein [Actinomadura rupiterrae]MCP2342214.1 hypothetical protein [Actinomadura rupiterrae]